MKIPRCILSSSLVRRLWHLIPDRMRYPLDRFVVNRMGDPWDSEVNFWVTMLSTNPDYRPGQYDKLLPKETLSFFQGESELTVLDVGSGPISVLTQWHLDGLLRLTPVDALANKYQTLLEKAGLHIPVPLVSGFGEKLCDLFPPATFDVTFCQNALDHTISPHATFANMVHVTKSGGFVILRQYEKTGTSQHWIGLHQHDLEFRDGNLLCTNRRGRTDDLTTDLPVRCVRYRPPSPPAEPYMLLVYKVER